MFCSEADLKRISRQEFKKEERERGGGVGRGRYLYKRTKVLMMMGFSHTGEPVFSM